MMAIPNIKTNDEVLILTADGFDETGAVHCLVRMREAGLPVSIVGISSGNVTSSHGISVRADRSLDQVMAEVNSPHLVVIPGGRRSALALQLDPRVSRLLQKVVARGGYLAMMWNAEEVLLGERHAALNESDHLLSQGEKSVELFTQQLIELTVRA